jgi:YD repeat-containing protein
MQPFVDVNRTARTAVATTTRTGIAGSMVENSVNGVSVSVTGFDGLTTSTTRDALLRTSSVTDSRGNTTSTTYVPGTGLTQTVTDASGATAATAYDTLGRASWQRDPRNHYTRFGYMLPI